MTVWKWAFFSVLLFVAGMMLETAISILASAFIIIGLVAYAVWKWLM